MKLFLSNLKSQVKKKNGIIKWSSPSNIALVKYWGKKSYQLPANPSLSFSLEKCLTQTTIEFDYSQDRQKLEFILKDSEIKQDQKLTHYLNKITELNPFFHRLKIVMKTENTFPHSAGVASSASAFSALALCLLEMELELLGESRDVDFMKRVSSLARLGSGSAARSVYGSFALWGECGVANSNDSYAIPVTGIHQDFKNIHNLICIVDSQKKSVSSSEGHALMDNHPKKEQRYAQARENTNKLIEVIKTGDWKKFQMIVEEESITLHQLMQTSTPSIVLMNSKSQQVIDVVKEFQKKSQHITYTLDAGPNVHILYHPLKFEYFEELKQKLAPLCQKMIEDKVDKGTSVCL